MHYDPIITSRLYNQHLIGEKFTAPDAVVAHFGAIQAQDFAAAKWSLGQRVTHATDRSIEYAYNEGLILRTHLMRPTWHFVLPQDIHWIQNATSANVKKLLIHYNRKLELTEEIFAKSTNEIIKRLKGTSLTRQEIKTILANIGIATDTQRLAHIVMWAELDGVICSGPKKGKQLTYALLSERVPKKITYSKEEALAKLATKYFQSHSPAQIKDFSWWSGLSIKEATTAIDSIKSTLTSISHNGKKYWIRDKYSASVSVPAFLLSIFDEYTIAYKDRTDMSSQNDVERMISMGNALTSVILINGRVVGSWKRIIKKDSITIIIKPFRAFSKEELGLLEHAKENYSKFLEMPVSIS